MSGRPRGRLTTVGTIVAVMVVVASVVGTAVLGWPPAAAVVGFGAGAVVLVAMSARGDRESAEATQEFARRVGWRCVGAGPQVEQAWEGRVAGLDVRSATHLVRGTFLGRPAASLCAVHRSTTTADDTAATTVHHVVELTLPVALPTLEITPDTTASWVAWGLGLAAQPLRLAGCEPLEGRWRVTSDHPPFAQAVVPGLVPLLLAPGTSRGMGLRVEGDRLLTWVAGGPDHDAVEPRLRLMTAVVDAVPAGVWRAHGHDPLGNDPAGRAPGQEAPWTG